MQFINKRILLHKSGRNNFTILDCMKNVIYQDILFVYMKDVSFIICEKNKTIFKETGVPTDHAWVEGILVDASPKTLKLNKEQLRMLYLGTPIGYNHHKDTSFFLTHSGKSIESAKELIGYNGKLKVLI